MDLPHLGWTKIYIDDAFKDYRDALALVVRNEMGKVIIISHALMKAFLAFEAEGKALDWASDIGCMKDWN